MTGKYIILIGGFLAAGKTSFSQHLSRNLQVLSVNKDHIKERLCDRIGFSSREENLKLSHATFDVMMHIAEQSMMAGLPIILESNFRKHDSEQLLPLIRKYKYTPVTIMMTGDLNILYARFIKRLDGRHPAHKSVSLDFESYSAHCRSLLDFDVGGEKISIDTTNFEDISYDDIITRIRRVLHA